MGKNWRGSKCGCLVFTGPDLLHLTESRRAEGCSLTPGELGAPSAPASVRTACPWFLGPFQAVPTVERTRGKQRAWLVLREVSSGDLLVWGFSALALETVPYSPPLPFLLCKLVERIRCGWGWSV